MLRHLVDWFVAIYEAFYGSQRTVSLFSKYDKVFDGIFGENGFTSVFSTLSLFIVAIASVILVIYMLIGLLDNVTNKTLTVEVVFKALLRLAVGALLVTYIYPVIYGITFTGTAITKTIADNVSKEADFFRVGKDELNARIDKENQKKVDDFLEEYGSFVSACQSSPASICDKKGDALSAEPDSGTYYRLENTAGGGSSSNSAETGFETVRSGLNWRLYKVKKTSDGEKTEELCEILIRPHSDYGINYDRFREGLTTPDSGEVKDIGDAYVIMQSETREFQTVFQYLLGAIVMFLLVFVSNLSTLFIGFTRLIELTIRALFSPIAVADIFTHGIQSPGIRYMKKIAALSIQFAVIVVINIGCSLLLQSNMFSPGAGNITDILLAGEFDLHACLDFLNELLTGGGFVLRMALILTKIGLTIKSLSICNDIVGV